MTSAAVRTPRFNHSVRAAAMARAAAFAVVVALALGAIGCGGSKPPLPLDRDLAGPPLIRVGVRVHVPEVTIASPEPFTITDGNGVLALGGPGRTFTIRRAGDRLEVLIGGAVLGTSEMLRVDPDSRTGELLVDGARLPQRVDVRPSPSGGLNAINVVDVETYLRAVVPREIGHAGDYLEAAKAQAVAARTYVARHMGQYPREGYDVEAGTNDQVYGTMENRHPDADRAVAATRGLILVHDGRPIRANYSSTCGGKTAAVEESFNSDPIPYLKSQDDRMGGETACRTSRYFRWEVSWTADELLRILARSVPKVTGKPWQGTGLRELKVRDRGPSGRATRLEIKTDRASYEVKKGAIRAVLERPEGGMLRSTAFELDLDRRDGWVTRVKAKGRGWGHGVGMCQWGAMQLSKDGYNYRRILEHYYPGAELMRWYDGLRAERGDGS